MKIHENGDFNEDVKDHQLLSTHKIPNKDIKIHFKRIFSQHGHCKHLLLCGAAVNNGSRDANGLPVKGVLDKWQMD